MHIDLIFVGLAVGALVGISGVGGASLLTPLLILMGINPVTAIGTDFFYNSITKVAGSIQHIKQKTVDFRLVKYLAIGSLPSGVCANLLFYYFLADYYKEEFVATILGFVLISISIIMFIQLIFHRGTQNRWKEKAFAEKRFMTITAGAVIGAVVGITSIGAGSLFALFILYFYKMNASELVGTDVTHAFLLTTVIGLIMAEGGHIEYGLAANLLCGSIPGALIGSKLTVKIPQRYIRIFTVVLIFISGTMLFLKPYLNS
jgi:uncharacterized membrane protein YfcA